MMIERMARHFSSRIEYQLVTPTYPGSQRDWALMTKVRKLDAQLFGGPSMRAEIRRFEPDVIYADNAVYASQFKIVSIFSAKKIPVIIHLRGDWWREYWSWFLTASGRKRLLSAQQYSYNWAAILLAQKVTPICKWLEKMVRHYVPTKKSEVVYQGVDAHDFYRDGEFEFSKPAAAIIQNHSIYPKVEGLLWFRKAAEALPEVHFYIAEGQKSGQTFLPIVRAHFANLANVHFVPGIDSAEAVRRMLASSDLYVLASGLDCCPTTVLEASLMRLPIIASKIGGVPEIILENETGWTVKNGETGEWVNRIRKLIEDSRLARRIGSRGREWVSDNFAWTKIAGQVESIINAEAEGRR